MDTTAKAAFIIAQSACLQARLAMMQQHNLLDKEAGRNYTFQPHDFEAAVDEFGLGHNAVLMFLRD